MRNSMKFLANLTFFSVCICTQLFAATPPIQVTCNNLQEHSVTVDDVGMAWVVENDSYYWIQYREWATGQKYTITSGPKAERPVKLSSDNGQIAWETLGSPRKIYFWTGSTIRSIVPNDTLDPVANEGEYLSIMSAPDIEGGIVCWLAKWWDDTDAELELHFWDGYGDIVRENLFPCIGGTGGTISYDNGKVAFDAHQVYQGTTDDLEIYLWNGSGVQRITYNGHRDWRPSLHNGHIAWMANVPNPDAYLGYDPEIAYWDGASISYIPHYWYGWNEDEQQHANILSRYFPTLYDGHVAYLQDGYIGGDHIIYFDGTESLHLSNYAMNCCHIQHYPFLHNGILAWTGYKEPGAPDTDVFFSIVGPTSISMHSLFVSKNPIPEGDTARVIIDPPVLGLTLNWDIVPKTGTARALINGVLDATISNVTGEGWMTVMVTSPDDPNFILLGDVQIGCDSCSGSCNISGNGWFLIGSIDARFRLGKAKAGTNAGDIFLRADMPDAKNSTPAALEVSTLGYADALYLGENLRQVLSPETFVDIEVVDEFEYNMNFYEASQRGDKVDGFYEVLAGAVPYVTWKIENPDRSLTVYNRLRISEIRDGSNTKVNEYVWNEGLQTWSLSKGNGQQVLTSSETIVSGNRVVRETTKDQFGVVASDVQKTFHEITCGGETREELIQIVENPDGAAFTTTINYYEEPCPTGSCGRIESQVSPDGSWVRYEYDEQSRMVTEISSWLDASAGTAAEYARGVYYAYSPVDASDSQAPEDDRLPRTVTETILGTVVARTYHVYQSDENGRAEIVEQCASPTAAYGDSSNLRTVTTYYPSDTTLPEVGRVKSVEYSDGRLDNYVYEAGTYVAGSGSSPGTFTPGEGTDVRETLIHGTVASPDGIAGKTTREKTVTDHVGKVSLEEVYVYSGGGEERTEWTTYAYDEVGHVIEVNRSDGTKTESVWGCCGKESETDVYGTNTSYTYDDLNRVIAETRHTANGDLVTSYGYDGEGRTLSQTVSGGGLSQTTTNDYDAVGRLESTIDLAGLVTFYGYASGGRVTTVTRPGGATEITENYLDGRTKSVTGTGVIPQYYEYGVNADGTQWTRVYTGSPTAPMWEKTTTDMLGRTVRVEKPGPAGTEVAEHYYDASGRLVRTTTTDQADMLYAYDELGNQIRRGLDVDGSGVLDNTSNDRIEESETSYVLTDGAWWEKTIQRVYAADFAATATTTSIQRRRFTGLGSGLVSEAVSIDVNENETIAQVFIDRNARTETRVVNYPDSTIDAVDTSQDGLLVSSQSKAGVVMTYSYDTLGRRIGVTDPRTGTTTTHYNTNGQMDYVQDPAGNRTDYTYDSNTGRLATQANALGHMTRYAYNDRGQVTHTWGDAVYPVKYVYDNYGRIIEMHTWRAETDWNTPAWPTEPGPGDVTKWHYDEATGLLVAKEDAAGQSVSYTYTYGGKLETRTWARLGGMDPLVTTYTYDAVTGNLLTIDYADSTPDINFTYDRLGRQVTVTDAVGTRTFAYDPSSLQLQSETITGLYSKTLTRTYETEGVVGRATGFNLGAGHAVQYGYDGTGRLNLVSWNIGGVADTASYMYMTNSSLIGQLTTGGGYISTYGYEANRDLRTQVKNEFGPTVISQYDYQYNELAQRTSVELSGRSFAVALNAKLAVAPWFENAENTGSGIDVLPETRSYLYDPIGNRTESTDWDHAAQANQTTTYLANNLNQYNEKTTPSIGTNNFLYDEDGNLVSVTIGSSTTRYTYNAENRLIVVQPQNPLDGDKKVEFAYDYMGRRVRKSTYTYQAGSWSRTADRLFVYDGWNLIEELTGYGQVLKSYVWGLDLSQSLQGAGGISGLIACVDGAVAYYYLYDANGNVGQLVNASDGSIAAHYEYDPYGNIVYSDGALANENPYRFSTKYFDPEISLYYYGYRYYSPEMGRWVRRDPVKEFGFFVQLYPRKQLLFHLSLMPGDGLGYLFVDNDPINHVDMYGLFISKGGIKSDRYIYTCNCGWLDRGHFSGYYKHYLNIYDAMKANNVGSIVIQSVVPASFGNVNRTYTWSLSGSNIDYYTEAMKLLYAVGKQEELDQSGAGLGLLGGWTAFAYEDIASDMFGGLIGKLMRRDNLTYDQAVKKALTGCGAVTEDEALAVYEANERTLRRTTHSGAAQSRMTCDPCDNKNVTPYLEWDEILKIAR